MLKRIRRHPATRFVTWLTTITTVGIQLIPTPLPARPQLRRQYVNELKAGLTDKPDAALRAKIAAQRLGARPDTRALSAKEMRAVRARGAYRNRALNGTMPWHREFSGANLCTGNLFQNFTDVQVKPARGAGLVLNRSYNSNDDRVGPFGVGWTHAYEIRNEEKGNDNVDKTDFIGGKHGYKRDADGLYTPPPYAHDVMRADASVVEPDGTNTVVSDIDVSPDGTTKHFVKNGDERVCDYIEDRHGNRTTLTYAGPTVALPDGETKTLLSHVTDPSGRTLTFNWGNLGTNAQPVWRVTEVVGPMYRVTYDYYTNPNSPNAANELYNLAAVHLDPDGLNRTTGYTYTGLTGPQGAVNGLLASVTDGVGSTVSYEYTLTNNAGGSTVTGTAWVHWVHAPGGVTAGGAPRTRNLEIRHQGAMNVGDWIASGSLLLLDGNYCELDTDAYLRVVNVNFEMEEGQHTTRYDTAGNVVWRTTSHADIGQYAFLTEDETWTYDSCGHLLTHHMGGATGQETNTYYGADKYFQKATSTDTAGRTSSFDYFANDDASVGNRGEVKWVRDARYATTGRQATYTYNQYGQKAVETNLNGVVTQCAYTDGWGNLTQVVQDPGGLNRTTAMTYDEAGNVLTSADPGGRLSQMSYNVLGQPASITTPPNGGVPGETITYAYGANGRTESVTDGRGTTTIAYEPGCGRVHSVTDPVTGTITYTYNVDGTKASVALPGGGTWTYAYGGGPAQIGPYYMNGDDVSTLMGRLVRVTDDQGRRIEIDSFDSGHPRWVRFNQVYDGTGLVSYCEARYDYVVGSDNFCPAFRLRALTTTYNWQQYGQWQSRVLSRNDYTYDNANQRQTNTITDQTGAQRTETYGYDELNRLTSVNYGDGEVQGYTFDPMGNRLTKTDNVTGNETYGYNAANMLTSRNGQAYTNDPNGNTLTGGGRTMTWDGQNRMVTCQYNGSTSSFVCGYDGLRRQTTVNGVTTDFFVAGGNVLRELRGGSAVATYLYGPRGPEYRRDDVTGQIRWYVYDGLGSVVGEADPNGNMTATRAHDVCGGVRSTSGMRTSAHGFCGALGHVSDSSTDLIYMGARYMDPAIGRFVSEDPGRHGANWYAYASDNPVGRTDASGRADGGSLGGLIDTLVWILNNPRLAADMVKEQLLDVLTEAADRGVPGARAMLKRIITNSGADEAEMLGRPAAGNAQDLLMPASEAGADEQNLVTAVQAEKEVAVKQAQQAGGWGQRVTVKGDEADQQSNLGGI